jgi:hypothetical protein
VEVVFVRVNARNGSEANRTVMRSSSLVALGEIQEVLVDKLELLPQHTQARED